jgi:signal transduction histidine kinase
MDENCPFNEIIFKKFDHIHFNRVFLTLIHRAEINNFEEEDKILGIIETGYYDKTGKKTITKQKLNSLKIYVDNVAQSLNTAISHDITKDFSNRIYQHIKILEPESYFKKLIKELLLISKPSACDSIMFQYENINRNERSILYDPHNFLYANAKISELILNISLFEKPIIIDASKLSSFCKDNIKVILSFPLIYSNTIIGVINLYYVEQNSFLKIKINYIKEFIDLFCQQYQKKKINQSVLDISLTFPLFINVKDKYINVIKTLSNYFISDNIIVWYKTFEPSGNQKYQLFIPPNKGDDIYFNTGILNMSPDLFKRDSRYIKYDLSEKSRLNIKILSFCRYNKFRSFISVPISFQNIEFGFIDIFFKRVFPTLNTEDEIFLAQIVNKLGVSSQLATLMNYFSEISNSLLTENLNSVLTGISRKAGILLNADPVVLYIYPRGGITKYSEAYYTGSFHDERIKSIKYEENEKEIEFVNVIAKHGTRWIENEAEYEKLKTDAKHNMVRNHFLQEFWYREKIKSFAAIKLAYNCETLGVMFVNYREEQRFNSDLRDFINAFASLISVAIVNVNFLSKIKEQREELLELAEVTNPGAIAIGYTHDAKHSMHNINALISSLIYLIPKDIISNPKAKSVIKSLEFYTNHLASLFTSLVNIAQEKKPIFKKEDARKILEEVEAAFETRFDKYNIKVKIKCDKDLLIKCDRSKLLQVFINLVGNSIHALQGQKRTGKEITIEITQEQELDRTRIVYMDNGPGIEKENLKKMFNESFSTKNSGGSGFGLLVIKRIITSHQGFIKVKSELGKYTAFFIYLPN